MANQYSRRQKTTTKSAKKTGKNPKESPMMNILLTWILPKKRK